MMRGPFLLCLTIAFLGIGVAVWLLPRVIMLPGAIAVLGALLLLVTLQGRLRNPRHMSEERNAAREATRDRLRGMATSDENGAS